MMQEREKLKVIMIIFKDISITMSAIHSFLKFFGADDSYVIKYIMYFCCDVFI